MSLCVPRKRGTQRLKIPRKSEHLQRRNRTYFFRMRIPADLQGVIGKKAFHHSLRTTDPAEAKRLVGIERLKAQGALAAARRSLALPTLENPIVVSALDLPPS